MPSGPPVLGWFLTYSQVGKDGTVWTKEGLLDFLRTVDTIREYVVCHELHQDGGDHYHCWVKFETGVLWKDVLRFKYNGHTADAKAARSARAVAGYCKKKGDYISNLENLETFMVSRGKKRNLEMLEKGALRCMTEGDIHPMNYMRMASSISQYDIDLSPETEPVAKMRGVYIYGPTGVGKSLAVERAFPKCYMKNGSKWFPGYTDQEVVHLEDLGPELAPKIAGYLKVWCGQGPLSSGETKNGHRKLHFTKFIVTSNYPLDQLGLNLPDYYALSRRFEDNYFEMKMGDRSPFPESPEVQTSDSGIVQLFASPPDQFLPPWTELAGSGSDDE